MMHVTQARSASRNSMLSTVGAAIAIVSLAALSSCRKPADGTSPSGHSQGKQATKVDEHAGHDHGPGEDAHVDEVTLTPDAITRYGIKVEAAQLWALRPTIIAPARVALNTEAMAHVGSPLRGRAVEVKVRLGDMVKAQQDLVTVESPELGEAQADFLQKKTAVINAGPAAELSKVAWDRAKGLFEQSQGISLTEVQKREAEYKAAVASVKAAESFALAAENRLHLLGMSPAEITALSSTGTITPRYTIRAAIDGQIVERELTLGELVSPDRESLMVIADTRTLWVLADVPQEKLMGVVAGARAWVTIGSLSAAELAAQPAHRFEGTVSFIAPFVDQSTRTAQVRIEVPMTTLALRPGMFAQAEIVLAAAGGNQPAPIVAVPDEALQTVEGGPAVFVPVHGEPNTFAKRSVKIGTRVGGLIPVTQGLLDGEQFVSSGSFILKAELGKAGAAHVH